MKWYDVPDVAEFLKRLNLVQLSPPDEYWRSTDGSHELICYDGGSTVITSVSPLVGLKVTTTVETDSHDSDHIARLFVAHINEINRCILELREVGINEFMARHSRVVS